MNTNRKKLKLVKEGIKASTLNKMSDKQVNLLYSRLLEQVTPVSEPAKTGYKVGEKGGNLPPSPKGYNVKKNPDGTMMAMPNEEEMKEEEDFNLIQDPDASADGMGMFEEKEIDEKFESKKQQKYFYAKCGDGKTKEQKKWCKMADEFAKDTNFKKLPEKKKETKEGYDDMVKGAYTKIMKNKLGQMGPRPTFSESQIEKQILKLVEKHITPKMSKQDFLNIIEGDTKTAPAKPKERERVKPKHPFKPDPNKKGAPKAKKTEMDEDTKTAPAKPKVSPGVKPKHPFKPDPDKKGAPKAEKKELPSFLTYKALGLNLK
jgi:hypothetical protein